VDEPDVGRPPPADRHRPLQCGQQRAVAVSGAQPGKPSRSAPSRALAEAADPVMNASATEPRARPPSPVVILPPGPLRAGDQPSEVPRRPPIPRGRQQPFRRDPARRGRNPPRHQAGDQIIITGTRPAVRRLATGLRTLDDALDRLMVHAAYRGGPTVGAHLLAGRDDVHNLPRRKH